MSQKINLSGWATVAAKAKVIVVIASVAFIGAVIVTNTFIDETFDDTTQGRYTLPSKSENSKLVTQLIKHLKDQKIIDQHNDLLEGPACYVNAIKALAENALSQTHSLYWHKPSTWLLEVAPLTDAEIVALKNQVANNPYAYAYGSNVSYQYKKDYQHKAIVAEKWQPVLIKTNLQVGDQIVSRQEQQLVLKPLLAKLVALWIEKGVLELGGNFRCHLVSGRKYYYGTIPSNLLKAFEK